MTPDTIYLKNFTKYSNNNNKRNKPMSILSILAILFTTVAAAKTTIAEQGWAVLFVFAAVFALIDFFNKE